MAATVQRITVTRPEQMQLEITRLVAQGYVVASQADRSATLAKRKQLNLPVLVITSLLCVLPGLVYLAVYALQTDQIVEITLVESAGPQPYRASEHVPWDDDARPAPGAGPVLQLSPDGDSWWDGATWRPTSSSYPPRAVRSQDGTQWWDGERWRPMPPPPQLPPPAQLPPPSPPPEITDGR